MEILTGIGIILLLVAAISATAHYRRVHSASPLSQPNTSEHQLAEEERRIKARQRELLNRISKCHRLADDYDKDGDPEALQQAAVLKAEADLAKIEHDRLEGDLARLERVRRDLEYKKITGS